MPGKSQPRAHAAAFESPVLCILWTSPRPRERALGVGVLRIWVAGGSARCLAVCLTLYLSCLCPWVALGDTSDGGSETCRQRLASAAQQMRENQGSQTCRILRKQRPASCSAIQMAESNYLRARALLAGGKQAAAIATLPAQVPELPQEIAVDWRKRRAQALAELGDCNAAIPALVAAEQEQSTQKDPRLPAARGRCLLQQGDAPGAALAFAQARALDRRTGRLDRATVGLEHATALYQAGQLDLAKTLLTDLSTTYPQHPTMAKVSALRAELGNNSPLTDQDKLRRAQQLYQARAFASSAKAYDTLPEPKTRSDRASHLHDFGKALFRSRTRYLEAARVLKRAARLGGPTAQEDAFLAARALARADRDRIAVREFDRFVRKHRRGPWVTKASYLAAWLSLRHHFPGARRRMQRFLKGKLGRNSSKRAEGTFVLAMYDFNKRRYRSAQRLFLRYAKSDAATGPSAMVHGRGLYWAARSAQARGHKKAAKRLFTSARTVEPLHYYSQLAELRLTELGEPLRPAALIFHRQSSPAPHGTARLPAIAAFYARLGLVEDALTSLSETSFNRPRTRRTLNNTLPKAQAYFDLGAPHKAAKLLMPFLSDVHSAPTTPTSAQALDLLYARPHPDTVDAYATRTGISPDLVWAIMRKESNFDPRAHSYADAIGLLQLLPETAARVATQARQSFARNDLFTPDRNIELGIRYLSQLQEEFPNHPALVIAAYNAGEHQVRSWVKNHKPKTNQDFELDLFVENIPINQTRNYVRRVLTNLAWYGYLRGEPTTSSQSSHPDGLSRTPQANTKRHGAP